jgi:hypothetical protein
MGRFAILLLSSGCCYIFGPAKPTPDSGEVRADCYTAAQWLDDGELSTADCADLCRRLGLTNITVTSCEQLSTCEEDSGTDTGGDTGRRYPLAIIATCSGLTRQGECY